MKADFAEDRISAAPLLRPAARSGIASVFKSTVPLLLLLLPSVTRAEMYRWVDDKGQVHYTQTPPRRGPYDVVAPASPPSSAPNQESLNEALDLSKGNEPEEQQKKQEAAELAAKRQAQCRDAMARVAFLQSSGRIFSINDQGERVYRTDQQLQQERAAAQQRVTEICE